MTGAILRAKIVDVCGRLHQRNLLAAADGNVSYRISDSEILLTPSGLHKGQISAGDISVIDIENRIIAGNPSSERKMHLAIYRKCAEAKAVVHAHPPTAIAWSVARPDLKEMPSFALSEVILAVGRIPFVPYARPGTEEMGSVLEEFLPECRALILSRHGAVAWGESLEEAYNGIERIEHIAQILKSAMELGGITNLDPAEVAYLYDLRRQLGPKIL